MPSCISYIRIYFSMFFNFAEMAFRWIDAFCNTTMSYFSHTDDTIPNNPSEQLTSKCELPYPFVTKDYLIRNAVLSKLDKKIKRYHYRRRRTTQYLWKCTINVLNIHSKFWFLNSMQFLRGKVMEFQSRLCSDLFIIKTKLKGFFSSFMKEP